MLEYSEWNDLFKVTEDVLPMMESGSCKCSLGQNVGLGGVIVCTGKFVSRLVTAGLAQR